MERTGLSKRTKVVLGGLLFFVAFLGICSLLQAQWKANDRQEVLERLTRDGVLIYGADEFAPPLRFVDKDGVYKGVVVDLMHQISLELGIEISTMPYPWVEALESLKTGETDICDMFINQERAEHYTFTHPIYNLRTVLAIRGSDNYGIHDIKNLRVATQKGDFANTYMQETYPTAVLVYVHDIGEGLNLLQEGRVDAVIGDEPVVYYGMGERPTGDFKLINTALYEEDVVLAVNKDKAALVPLLNEAIDSITNKGQLEKIQQKWFGISTPLLKVNPTKDVLKVFGIPIAVGLGLLALFVVNNLSLKRQVRARTKELEGSRNELQLIFDGITEYIAVVNQDKIIVNANGGLATYFKVEKEQMKNQSCKDYLKFFCRDCDRCQVDLCMQKGGTVRREVTKDNEVYEMVTYPLIGLERGAMVSLNNITLEKIRRNQLLQSSKMMAIGQLAAGMAHEIRNPLGIIRTQSYLLRSNEKLDETGKKSLDFIDSNVKRAGGIIDNIMNFWRLSDDKPQQIDLKESLGAILSLQNEGIAKKKIVTKVECQEGLRIFCSAETLKHILLNLSSNAIDALGVGGILRFSASLEKDAFLIRCEDNGSGIDEKNLENLFHPFFTTKEPGQGTGLGLFIVYSEVERLRGTITVESKVGEGTAFCIRIPQKEVRI